MESTPFAFSVHHFINSVGADAGFASIIGLAILILLYFAQARETASLRAHAYEAAERIHDLEARLAHVESTPQAAPRAAPAAGVPPRAYPNAAPVPAVGATAPPVAWAPAGVGAPALTAATKLIPTAAAAALDPPGEEISVAGPRPATVAAGANGSSSANATLAPRRAAQTTQPPSPRVPLRPGQTTAPGRRPAPPPPRGAGGPRSGGGSRRIIGILLAALGVVGIVVAVLLILTTSSSKSPSPGRSVARTTNTPTPTRASKRTAVNPAAVTVAVLNGTNTTGLAARVAQNLQTEGYKQGAIQTATDQTHATSVVGYLPGFKADAQAVAESLKLAATAVAPVDQPAQAVACPTAGSCVANVIVTVGSDLATTQ